MEYIYLIFRDNGYLSCLGAGNVALFDVETPTIGKVYFYENKQVAHYIAKKLDAIVIAYSVQALIDNTQIANQV